MLKIENCPFCDGKGQDTNDQCGEYVMCDDCGARGPYIPWNTEGNSIELWNNWIKRYKKTLNQ